MNKNNLYINKSDGNLRTSYKSLSLIDLISLIAEKQDSQALYEFHGRPLFCDGNERGLTCSEYISFFRVKTFNYKGMDIKALEIADIAYDLTIDKFSNLFSDTPCSSRYFFKLSSFTTIRF